MAQIFIIIFLALAVALLAVAWLRARATLHVYKGKVPGSPIPLKAIYELDPLFALTVHGPARDTEVAHIAMVHVEGGVSDLESWILCNLAKRSRRIFEFGTATGKTTYLMARNAPADAQLVTITLHPDQADGGAHEAGDDAALKASARRESAFDTFLYSGSAQEPRISQLFGDSKAFDETPYAGTMDLIFLDGAHTRSYVASDTHKALAMLAPGGWLLWHDYRGRRVPGVFETLNALSRELPLTRIIVAHRPETIASASRVIVLGDGRVAQDLRSVPTTGGGRNA